MDFATTEHETRVVPGRECGTCTLCCKVYKVAVLSKPEGVWCTHCAVGRGCRIHETRPLHCRQFFCLWMTNETLPPSWKPEISKMAISIFPDNGFVYVQVDPGSPQAWRKEPYFTGLKQWSARLLQSGKHLIVFVHSHATLMMPSGPVPMGPMSPDDAFVVRERFTDAGKTYDVERIPQPATAAPR